MDQTLAPPVADTSLDYALKFELCGKWPQNCPHHSGLDPLLESAMAGLVRRISIRKFNPGSTRA